MEIPTFHKFSIFNRHKFRHTQVNWIVYKSQVKEITYRWSIVFYLPPLRERIGTNRD